MPWPTPKKSPSRHLDARRRRAVPEHAQHAAPRVRLLARRQRHPDVPHAARAAQIRERPRLARPRSARSRRCRPSCPTTTCAAAAHRAAGQVAESAKIAIAHVSRCESRPWRRDRLGRLRRLRELLLDHGLVELHHRRPGQHAHQRATLPVPRHERLALRPRRRTRRGSPTCCG